MYGAAGGEDLVKVFTLVEGILPKGPYPPCLRMADRALSRIPSISSSVKGFPPQGDVYTDIFSILNLLSSCLKCLSIVAGRQSHSCKL